MTEEDAKTKWCPFSRVHATHQGNSQGPAANRLTRLNDDGSILVAGWSNDANCVGSACMAWHFASNTTADREKSAGTRHGFCGLAGRPA